jgi:hypothetical protein
MTRSPRRGVPLYVLLLALALSLLPSTALAATDRGAEARLIAMIDQERRSRGETPLRVAQDLTSVARRHSVRMADRGELSHNPNLGGEVSGWDRVGENVGRGPDASAIHRSLMGSASHRDNILAPDYREVGVGVERRGDTLWVTQVFRDPSGSTTARSTSTTGAAPADAPAPAPPPPPAPQPAPATPAPVEATTAPAEPQPAVIDRLTVTLARIEAEDHDVPVSQALQAG